MLMGDPPRHEPMTCTFIHLATVGAAVHHGFAAIYRARLYDSIHLGQGDQHDMMEAAP